jgi:bacillolysin
MRFLSALLLAACSVPGSSSDSTPGAAPPTPSDDVADTTLDPVEAEDLASQLLAVSPDLLPHAAELRVKRSRVDEAGLAHVHLQQELDGVPVFGGEAIVHLAPNGTMFGLTDDTKPVDGVDTVAEYTADEAVDVAEATLHRSSKFDEPSTATLFVLDHAGAPHLTWRVEVTASTPRGEPLRPIIFVDAHSGEVLSSYDNVHHAPLSDADKVVYDMAGGTRFSRAVVGDSADANLALTYNAIASTLNFLWTAHGRDSYDGRGAVVKAYGHFDRSYVNAYWDGSKLVFGDGDGVTSRYLGVLDVTAHEFGHAVTTFEANLTYSGESGALNEGASDSLAAAVESWVDGTTNASTWDIGEDCWLAAPALRYMDAPSLDGSSRDHYAGRYVGTSDNGGVHWNSGIANHFFYLLSEGGQHHNPAYRTGTAVVGIGVGDAYAIWYSALNNYMTSGTTFAGARAATEAACVGLGYAATTCASVSAAWAEVGVSSATSGGGGTDPGPTACPSGYRTITGTLTGTGDDDQHTYTAANGVHAATLAGPSSANFDLVLYKSIRRRYTAVASATSASSAESISYSGTSGDYLMQVKSTSGSGSYQLCMKTP